VLQVLATVTQTIAMFLVAWSPWAPEAHKLHIALRDGREIRTWTVIPGPNSIVDPLEFAQGVNLPAAAIVVPAEFVARRGLAGGTSVLVHGRKVRG
jgi:hypothetical protein